MAGRNGQSPRCYAVAELEDHPPQLASLLIVEDQEANRRVLAELLRLQGYQVSTCGEGRAAMEMLRQGGFDLVLLDVLMQDMSGLDVLHEVRELYSATDLPVIMVTGLDGSDDIVHALTLGANDYVTKPLDLPVLLARVRTQLSLKEAVERVVRLEQVLERHNAELEQVNDRMRGDLEAAARVQAAFLPQEPPRLPGVASAWVFQPCAHLAGDMLNVFRLDERTAGFYLLDVSGHGVAASLLAVSLSRVLQPMGGPPSFLVRRTEEAPGYRLVPPAEVAAQLNDRFPWDPLVQQFFTIIYGMLDTETGECRYISAGHPGPIHASASGAARMLSKSGLPIGVADVAYEEYAVRLAAGDRLVLFSDGTFETVNPAGEPFGAGRLRAAVERGRDAPLAECLEEVWTDIRRWSGAAPLADDVSMLALEYMPPSPPPGGGSL